MIGVEGLGRAVWPGAGAPPWAGELAGSLDRLALQVTPDNVLQVAAVLQGEADRVKADGQLLGREVRVRECGADPVSIDAAREFTPRLQAMVAQGLLVAQMLEAAAERLRAAAARYRWVEADNRAALGEVRP